MKYLCSFFLLFFALLGCKKSDDKIDNPLIGNWKLVQVQADSAWKSFGSSHVLTLSSTGVASYAGVRDSLRIGSLYDRYTMQENRNIWFRPSNEFMSTALSVQYTLSRDTLMFQLNGAKDRAQRYVRQR
jgi:hypothetical protein